MSKIKIILFIFFQLCATTLFSQAIGIDSILRKLAVEKDEDRRIDLIYQTTAVIGESDPLLGLKYGQELLKDAYIREDKIAEAYSKSFIGKMYVVSGNVEKGLESAIKGKEIADEAGNKKLRAITDALLGLVYKNLFNYQKAIAVYKASEQEASEINYTQAQVWAYQSLSEMYLALNKVDSSLIFAQKDYELSLATKYSDFMGYTFINLGNTHAKLNNRTLALGYFDMAIQFSRQAGLPKQLNTALTAKAQYFNEINQKDSAIFYAKQALTEVQNTGFEMSTVKPAKLLLEIYRDINIDSAFKYSELHRSRNEGIFNAQSVMQTQMLTLEDEFRQQKLAEENRLAAERRKQNIQYILIALGILIFIILFLLLSRNTITNEKVIHYLGIVALLIVFEFLNLLLHPFLGKITHHSPILMLLGLVCIGALLVPMHHKVEKWAITKLVEKNRQIRLASAEKTIQELKEK